MKIAKIYEKYKIMPNLQLHMLRVAGVAKIICDNFNKSINKKGIITACLIHDMGNIVRKGFKFYPDSLGGKSKEYWEKVQKEYRKKYGDDEHKAARKIAKEMGIRPGVQKIIDTYGFTNTEEVLKTNSLEVSIATYSDHQVTPDGVVSMKKRQDDDYQRHVVKKPRFDADLFNSMRKGWSNIEKQIFKNASIGPDFITDEKVNKEIEKLKNFEV